MIVSATKNDHKVLTNLTRLSKAHWGYSAEQLEKWRDELTITAPYIEANEVFKYCLNEQFIIGYYACFYADESTVKLDNLFIHPDYIGKGYGRIMMENFITRVKGKANKITLDADPNAALFYRKLGFKVVGKLATSILGRYMPVLELDLTKKQKL